MDKTRPNLQPINRSDLLADTIIEKVAELILNNELSPGDQLPETYLAEQFGVSRLPVREGLRRLEQMGLVEKQPYHPAVVSRLTEMDIRNLYEVRLMIEPKGARCLTERQSPDAIAKIKSILFEMQETAAEDNRRGFMECDMELHGSLVILNGNLLLSEMWGMVMLRLRRFLWLKSYRSYKTLAEGIDLHRPIFDAILSGDGIAAEKATREHIMDVFTGWQNRPTSTLAE